jgi:uncharacterized low-complexity protein
MTKNFYMALAGVMALAVATPAIAQTSSNQSHQTTMTAQQRAAARKAADARGGHFTTGTDESSGGTEGTDASGTGRGTGTGSERR